MIGTHTRAMLGLALSRGQRLRSLVVLLGSGALLSISLGVREPDWGTQALMLLLTAALLVQWRATLFFPAGVGLELPIPLNRRRMEWITSGVQASGTGAVSLCLSGGLLLGAGHDLAEVGTALMDYILLDVLVGTVLLVPVITLMGRLMRGADAPREIFIWAGGPALGGLSVICMALQLPQPVVYSLWLGVFVALIVTIVLLTGRMVDRLRRWRQRAVPADAAQYRTGADAETRLAADGRAGIFRAIRWLVASDVVGGALMWLAFSSWMVHDVGLSIGQAQNFVVPVGMALLVGVRILAVSSLLGQVGLVGGFAPWAAQPWMLLPLSRSTIQRELLRHIGVVALVAIGLNIAFLATWGGATDGVMWTVQHVGLRDLISNMVQSLATVTAIMAMAYMVVGPGLRSTAQLASVGVGAALCCLIFVRNMPVPSTAAEVPIAVINAAAMGALMAAVWALSWRCTRRSA